MESLLNIVNLYYVIYEATNNTASGSISDHPFDTNTCIAVMYSEMTLSGFPSSNVIEIGNSYLDNVR